MKRIEWVFIIAMICLISHSAYGQLFSGSILHDGLDRTYEGYIPPSLGSDPQGYPLVIGLHGTTPVQVTPDGEEIPPGSVFIGTASLISRANTNNFIVACPNGLNYGLTSYFNAGEYYETLTNGTDDLGFISRLIDEMILNYPVDPTRVYAMGHSNGGIMAYRLAAQLPHKIAAIASNSGPMVYEYDPIAPVPIIHMHGLRDPLIPYEGTVLNGVTVPPVDEVMETWRLTNGCDENPVQIYYDNKPLAYGEIIGKKWASADGKYDVVLYTFARGGHEWRYNEDGLSATDTFWDFLKVHAITLEPVTTDIKPGSCQNPLNTKSKGVLSVAILGTIDFDVTQVNLASVRLNGVAPIRSSVNDILAPLVCEYLEDGYEDLSLRFETEDIVSAIGPVNDGAELALTLSGTLLDGTPIQGEDSILVIGQPWDVNRDSKVDILDLVIVARYFEKDVESILYLDPDMNGDETVDMLDIVLVAKHFGEVYSPAAPSRNIWEIDQEYIPLLTKIYSLMENNPSSDPDFLAAKSLLHRFIFGTRVSKTEVFQNYPNPFNPDTWIPYQLREDSDVVIKIYTSTGQLVRTLNPGHKLAGIYTSKEKAAYWDGGNEEGEKTASGIYFYNVQAGDFTATKKMTITE